MVRDDWLNPCNQIISWINLNPRAVRAGKAMRCRLFCVEGKSAADLPTWQE
jgi:hypothetical protein